MADLLDYESQARRERWTDALKPFGVGIPVLTVAFFVVAAVALLIAFLVRLL